MAPETGTKLVVRNPDYGKWETILPVYQSFFHYSRKMGVFPYSFNSLTLEVSPISSGFPYYLYLFNTLFVLIHVGKANLLFLYNVANNFKMDVIKGAYFFQLIWITSLVVAEAMMYTIGWNRKELGALLSSSIRLERQILTGKCKCL